MSREVQPTAYPVAYLWSSAHIVGFATNVFAGLPTFEHALDFMQRIIFSFTSLIAFLT